LDDDNAQISKIGRLKGGGRFIQIRRLTYGQAITPFSYALP
jgi:hypothetical protein